MTTITKARRVTFEPLDGSVQCNDCRRLWWLLLRPGGRLPRRWWQCPDGCNAEH
jgi:hypothetical protein